MNEGKSGSVARIPEYGSWRDSDRSASSNPSGSSGWAARSSTASGDLQRRSEVSTDLAHGPARGRQGTNPICKGRLWMLAEMLPPLPPSSARLVGLTPLGAADTCVMQIWCKLVGLHRHPRSESAAPQPGPGMLHLYSPSRRRDGSRGWDSKGRLPFLRADLGCPARLVPQWACCRNQRAWEKSHRTGVNS